MTFLSVLVALIADRIFGELKRCHPVVGFGHYACFLERRIFVANLDAGCEIAAGVFAWSLAILPGAALLVWCRFTYPQTTFIVDAAMLYICIAHRSLREHVTQVFDALCQNDIKKSRIKVGAIVSRDVSQLDAGGVRKAAIESALENGSDAVFAAIFWFVLLGAPGVAVYRMANTLDAMWGYRNRRYGNFGKFAAKMDDLLNWAPARLVALSYVLLGNSQSAWRAWKTQAHACASPNGGPVMASGAGALGIQVGGEAFYEGKVENRSKLGYGSTPDNTDILRALYLVDKTLVLWCATVAAVSILFYAAT